MLSSTLRIRSPRTEYRVIPMPQNSSEIRAELVQLRPEKGKVEANLGRIRETVERASGEVDLLVFPECAISGYFVEGGVEEVSRGASEVAAALGTPRHDAPDVVVGFYEKGRGPSYNSVGWFSPESDGYRLVHRHRKVFLPTYGVFDEGRFVAPGDEFRAFDTRFGRVGMLICEEMLHSMAPTLLALDRAELIVVVSASPARDFRPKEGRPGNLEFWDLVGRATALEHGVHVAICHLVGSEGGKVFPGGSTFYLPGGEVGERAPLFQEGSAVAVLDRTRTDRERARTPLLSDLGARLPHLLDSLSKVGNGSRDGVLPTDEMVVTSDQGDGLRRDEPPEAPLRADVPPSGLPDPEDASSLDLDLPLLEQALLSFLRDEIGARRGFRDVVIGVSGGVDSAVALFLAVRALGPEHVHAFLLPYATSHPGSLEDGRRIIQAVGVVGRTIEITPAVDAYVDGEEPDVSGLRRGNLAARIRSVILWDQAARLKALPLGTGNKSERLLGYFTWHADDSPPVNPLGDLFKTQVWSLARHLGVPERIVEKAPSADLVRGVHDEDELGVSYQVADKILFWLLSGYSPKDLGRAGFDPEAVDTVTKRLDGTHWKRELPTVAMLSTNSIGDSYLRPVDY